MSLGDCGRCIRHRTSAGLQTFARGHEHIGNTAQGVAALQLRVQNVPACAIVHKRVGAAVASAALFQQSDT